MTRRVIDEGIGGREKKVSGEALKRRIIKKRKDKRRIGGGGDAKGIKRERKQKYMKIDEGRKKR